MNIDKFDYHLPHELIAQFPSRRRDQSRLLTLERSSGSLGLGLFHDVLQYLNRGDALVVNTTKVFKARLIGRRASGGKVEIFLVRRVEPDSELTWLALVHPSRRVRQGETIDFGGQQVELSADVGGGRWHVSFRSLRQRQIIVSNHGHVPLPHYIKRDDQPTDLRRYQTVFADKDKVGAVAAPTAGFHFTPSILKALRDRGVAIIELCLHVGPGTFKPVKVDRIEDHVVDPEMAELSPAAAAALNRVRAHGGKVIAVGTTSVRTLESAEIVDSQIQPFSKMVDLYIQPGYQFRVVDHLITNFHLPKSSLLILVSAFAGRRMILDAYALAISHKYRFYSYGDAMLIL
ncbi:MAG: tRNA preQ1(34) S-adenosylmethionine ribosyltransferase-isomerase QueA [bacterium]